MESNYVARNNFNDLFVHTSLINFLIAEKYISLYNMFLLSGM